MADIFPTTVPGLSLCHSSLSDIGCKREQNEDAVGFFTSGDPADTCLLVIADGVGGSAAGEVASQLAVDTVGRYLFAAGEPADLEAALRDALQTANHTIHAEAAQDPTRAGMATTCTAAAIRDLELLVAHVGDCRAYLAQNGRLRQITADHSLAADYERCGRALPPEKKSLANVLTRWLGTDLEVEIDISARLPLQEGSSVILCSDGLTKVVREDEILGHHQQPPDTVCRQLVDLARERGGPDNITVQVARICET